MPHLRWLIVLQLIVAIFGKFISRDALKRIRYPEHLLVETTNGTVAGYMAFTEDRNTPYVAFRGIPYAVPPIGDLRFRPPRPANNWTEVLLAYKDGNVCVQDLPTRGNEDCLTINVYSPKFGNDGDLLSVLVWIYDGGFIVGDSTYERYGPEFFINENLIFVSFNYRLGIFGFMSTEDMASPGNYGLKDQILALKWVRDNIKSFGGDPNKVTIFGESAGAASVAYLVQTPLAAGLFKRAIGNSGNTLCQWALTRNPRQIAVSVAKSLLINYTNTSTLVEGLRRIDYAKLNTASIIIQKYRNFTDVLNGYVYSPTIEPHHSGAVLSGRSHQLLTEYRYNNVSYLMGFNSKEAGGWLEGIAVIPLLLGFDINSSRLVPVGMNVSPSNLSKIGSAIRNLYFNGTPIALSHRRFENFVSDDQFVRPIREFVRLLSRNLDVYYYRFSYMGNLGIGITDGRRQSKEGVSHAEDLNYFFPGNMSYSAINPADIRTRYRLVQLWSNFAKYGNPTPTSLENIVWPITRKSPNDTKLLYLDIGDNLEIRENPEEETISEWYDLYNTYGNPPHDTY